MSTSVTAEARHGIVQRGDDPLEVFFAPASVAVFGATETPGSVGRAVMTNLIRHPFGGVLLPICPTQRGVLGAHAYPSLVAAPVAAELAVVTSPAADVPGILRACAAAGVKGAILMSAGGRESDPAGAEQCRQVVEELRGGSLRVLGPGCLGVTCPRTGLNATLAGGLVPRGNVGFLSQSGAPLTALLNGGLPEGVGCSAFVSLGSMLDLGWAEWLEYFRADPQTGVVAVYAESLGDARSFFRAAGEVTPYKPVILLKGGRTVTAHHSHATAGHEAILDEACRRAGVLRVATLADLFRMAELLSVNPAPPGRRLAILSNATAPAVLAADALLAEGGEPATLAPGTVAALESLLCVRCHPRGPIDVGGDADAERYARAAALAAGDPNTDGLVLILTPQATMGPVAAAEWVSRLAAGGKPLLACWMWGASTPASLRILHRAGIPTFACPDEALRACGRLWRHGENLDGLYEFGPLTGLGEPTPDRGWAEALVVAARRSGRTVLTEAEAVHLLESFSLPTIEARVASREAEAVEQADAVGYPVVLEVLAENGGGSNCLHAADAAAVRHVYRVLERLPREDTDLPSFRGVRVQPAIPPGGQVVRLRSVADPHFGPILHIGLASPWAAAGPQTVALAPLSTARVRQLIAQAPPGTVLRALGEHGPAARAALEQFLVRFSRFVAEQRWVKEVCIDRLVVAAGWVLALDPSVTLHGPDVREEELPGSSLRFDPAGARAVQKRTGRSFAPPFPHESPLSDELELSDVANDSDFAN
jgi:acetyltransferase